MGVRVLQVLGHQLQAVLAAGHLVGFFGVDGVGRLVATERQVAGGLVDDALLRRVHCRRLVPVVAVVKVFWSVVEPAPWVAEMELRVREQRVDIVVGRHRSCRREMRILPLVTVMITRSSRA